MTGDHSGRYSRYKIRVHAIGKLLFCRIEQVCRYVLNAVCGTSPHIVPVVPGQAGGGSFQKEKNYIAQKEFAYRMCAW